MTTGVISGPLSMTAPASAALGSGPPGTTISVQPGNRPGHRRPRLRRRLDRLRVLERLHHRAGSPAETIPAGDDLYDISGLTTATGPATFGYVPQVALSANPQDVVNATNVDGNTTVTWNPVLHVTVPGGAIGGTYTGTIVHSVS